MKGCQIPVCSLLCWLAFHLAFTVSTLQFQKFRTLSLQIFKRVPVLTLSVLISRSLFPAGLPIPLASSFFQLCMFVNYAY